MEAPENRLPPPSPDFLQLHLRQRAAVHLHYLHVLRKLHARTQHATVAVVQEGVQLRRVINVADRAISGVVPAQINASLAR